MAQKKCRSTPEERSVGKQSEIGCLYNHTVVLLGPKAESTQLFVEAKPRAVRIQYLYCLVAYCQDLWHDSVVIFFVCVPLPGMERVSLSTPIGRLAARKLLAKMRVTERIALKCEHLQHESSVRAGFWRSKFAGQYRRFVGVNVADREALRAELAAIASGEEKRVGDLVESIDYPRHGNGSHDPGS